MPDLDERVDGLPERRVPHQHDVGVVGAEREDGHAGLGQWFGHGQQDPVSEKSSGPSTSRAICASSRVSPLGTWLLAQTTPNSFAAADGHGEALAGEDPGGRWSAGGEPDDAERAWEDAEPERGGHGPSLPRCAPMSEPDWHAALAETLAAHGLETAVVPRLAALLELLRDDPTAPTSVTDPAAAVAAHITDSLDGLAVPAVRAAQRIADLGAGAGFPGLPLAVALPQARVDLVESLSRKCAFLERAIAAAAAANAHVACARAESWDQRDLDVVVARAVAPLNVLVEYAAPLLRSGGTLVAWKGRPSEGEEADAAAAAGTVGLEMEEPIVLPGRPGAEHRVLYLYSKVRPTPSRFPRRPGIARKRPLSA